MNEAIPYNAKNSKPEYKTSCNTKKEPNIKKSKIIDLIKI